MRKTTRNIAKNNELYRPDVPEGTIIGFAGENLKAGSNIEQRVDGKWYMVNYLPSTHS